jgi:hypothetical protein
MVKFHYLVMSRQKGLEHDEVVEAQTTNRAAANQLVIGLKRLRRDRWELRIEPLTGRGKATDWN